MSDKDQHLRKDRYMLRLPDGMRDRIKAAAEKSGRSMNAEIVATLEEAYPELPTFSELTNYVVQVTKQLEKMEPGPELAEATENLLLLIEALKSQIPGENDLPSDPETSSPFDHGRRRKPKRNIRLRNLKGVDK